MTDNADRTARILGRLGTADGAGLVRIEDRYDTDPGDLWSAITDPGRLARWHGEVEGDLRLGGEFAIYVSASQIHALGRVEECDPPRRLRVVTRETDESAAGGSAPPFDQVIEATLTPDGAHTVLVIEVRGMPLDKVAFYGAGWQIHAETLAAFVAGLPPGDDEARWAELVPSYQEQAAALD